MEILKQIFPYNLNGPWFLVFYIILLFAICIYSYHILKKKITANLLQRINHLHVENAYELAYLKGGDNTFYELMISELIEEKKITPEDHLYKVNKSVTLNNPAAIYLDTLDKEVVSLEQLFEIAQTELRNVKEKYINLQDPKDNKLPRTNIYYLLAFECIGLIRLWQGIQNDKPIGFLVVLMLIGVIFQYSLPSWSIQRKQASKYFGINWEEMHVDLSSYQKRLLTYGFASISVGTALYHLSPFFNSLRPNRSFYDNSACNNCGSDCGSSCGSSCSGCGGCGGCGD